MLKNNNYEEEEKVSHQRDNSQDYDHFAGFRETLARQIHLNNQEENEVDPDQFSAANLQNYRRISILKYNKKYGAGGNNL